MLEKGPGGSILRPADALVQGLDVSPRKSEITFPEARQAVCAEEQQLTKRRSNRLQNTAGSITVISQKRENKRLAEVEDEKAIRERLCTKEESQNLLQTPP